MIEHRDAAKPGPGTARIARRIVQANDSGLKIEATTDRRPASDDCP